MEEVWKDIKGYEGYYRISNMGNVLSIKRVSKNGRNCTQRIIASHKDKKGYLIVNLHKDSKPLTLKIHRLVAYNFIDNPCNYPQVNHIDGIKSNNIVTNLEWCNQSMNTQHAYDNGLKIAPVGEDCKWSKLTDSDVVFIKYCKLRNILTDTQLYRLFDVDWCTLHSVLDNETWRHITITTNQK